MSEKVVYLMRGLPACGKSFTARRVAGATGVVLETDQFFYTEVGTDANCYDYAEELLPQARRWNFACFEDALANGVTPIVIDRGNGLNVETQEYARFAIAHGYRVELKEPESHWWQEIRVLLKYKHVTREILDQWAEELARLSRSTHRVPVAVIRHWMHAWKHDLTLADILDFQPNQ